VVEDAPVQGAPEHLLEDAPAPAGLDHERLVTLATAGSGDQRVAARILKRLARRRTWALHRHVHLVAAFETALAEGPVETMLSVGAGSGLSELYLAASHPEVQFTLTELDEARMAWAREMSTCWEMENVSYAVQDLLAPCETDPAADFVASIEVLEHIDDDETAARNLIACSRRFVFALVPYCSAAELDDPRRARRAWSAHGHHRVGYTHETFAAVLGDHERLMLRNCYFNPEAAALRARLSEMSDEEAVEARLELTREAADDVQDRVVAGGTEQAQGIEALLRIDHPIDPPDAGRSDTTGGRGFDPLTPIPTTTGPWS